MAQSAVDGKVWPTDTPSRARTSNNGTLRIRDTPFQCGIIYRKMGFRKANPGSSSRRPDRLTPVNWLHESPLTHHREAGPQCWNDGGRRNHASASVRWVETRKSMKVVGLSARRASCFGWWTVAVTAVDWLVITSFDQMADWAPGSQSHFEDRGQYAKETHGLSSPY